MSDFSLKGLRIFIAPVGGTKVSVCREKPNILFPDRLSYYRICTFEWDQKKRVYRIVNETPEFWQLKLNEPEFSAYINELYECLIDYHWHLDALRHERRVLEELFNTSSKRAKEAQK